MTFRLWRGVPVTLFYSVDTEMIFMIQRLFGKIRAFSALTLPYVSRPHGSTVAVPISNIDNSSLNLRMYKLAKLFIYMLAKVWQAQEYFANIFYSAIPASSGQ